MLIKPGFRMRLNIQVKATINGEVVDIYCASKDRHAYDDLENSLEYLGQGYYHSYNNVPAKDPELQHFWIKK